MSDSFVFKSIFGFFRIGILLGFLLFGSVACTNVIPEFYYSKEQSLTTEPTVSFVSHHLRVDESSESFKVGIQLSQPSILNTTIEIATVGQALALSGLSLDLPKRYPIPAGVRFFEASIQLSGNSTSPGLNDISLPLSLSVLENGITIENPDMTLFVRDDDYCQGIRLEMIPFANSEEGGNGETTPFTICTPTQLLAISNADVNFSKNYILMNNLDLAGMKPSNYKPIGNSTNPFIGHFNGNQYKIKNLTIHRKDDNFIGMFGVIGDTGKVNDLDLYINTIEGNMNVGGLAGRNSGTIERVSVTSLDSQNKVIGHANLIGGFTGENTGTISNCSAIVNVEAENVAAGGFVGIHHTVNGKITNSFYHGTLIGQDAPTGGFAGSVADGASLSQNIVFGGVVGSSGNGFVGTLIGRVLNAGTINRNFVHHNVECTNSLGSCNQSGSSILYYNFSNPQTWNPLNLFPLWDFSWTTLDGASSVWTHQRDVIHALLNMPVRSSFQGPKYHHIFVTSQKFDGNLGGLSGADEICQNLARKSDLEHITTRTFQAVLSDSTGSAEDRLLLSKPIINSREKIVATNPYVFWNGSIDKEISSTEAGFAFSDDDAPLAWTGGGRNLMGGASHCSDWSTPDPSVKGTVGDTTSLSSWQIETSSSCSIPYRIICISVD